MENVKRNSPSLIIIFLEIVIGILLLINPQLFTRIAIICIGILLLILGVVYLLRYNKEKKLPGSKSNSTLVISIIALVLGIICTFFSWWIVGLFAVVAVFYGIIMIISGIFKIQNYSENKKLGFSTTLVSIAGAILSIVLGIIIVINPFSAVNMLWIFIGIALLVEAVLDIIALAKTGGLKR